MALLIGHVKGEKEVFSGAVLTGKGISIDNKTFTFLYDLNSEKIFVDAPASGVIISRGECDKRDAYKICIDRANFSSRNYTTYVDTYELGVRVYKITPEIVVNRTASIGELLQGEKSIVSVTIENPSDFEVESIEYREDFSKFDISELEGCEIRDGVVYWKGFLRPKNVKKCSFKIAAYKKMAAEMVANLSYNDGFSTIYAQSSVLGISVKDKQLKVSTYKPSVLEPLIIFQYSMLLENLNTGESISVQSSSLLPSYLKVKKKPDEFWAEGNNIRANINLKPGEKKNLTLTIEPGAAGDMPIKHRFRYAINNLEDEMEYEDGVLIKDIKPEIALILSSEAPKPGEKFVAAVDLKNPSIYHDLKNIKAELASEFSETLSSELKTLKRNESYRIISNTLIAPNGIDKRQYPLNLTVFYDFNDKLYRTGKNDLIGKSAAIIETMGSGETNISLSNMSQAKANDNSSVIVIPEQKDDGSASADNAPMSDKSGESENKSSAAEDIQAPQPQEQQAPSKPQSTGAEESSRTTLPGIEFSPKNIVIVMVFVLFGVLITLKFVFRSRGE